MKRDYIIHPEWRVPPDVASLNALHDWALGHLHKGADGQEYSDLTDQEQSDRLHEILRVAIELAHRGTI